MKNLFRIYFLLTVITIPLVSHSTNLSFLEGSKKEIRKEIKLEGALGGSSTVKSILQTPIEATICSSSLDVDFLSNMGNIDIQITSASEGFVYNNSVNTQTQTSLSINVSDWDNGIYEIRFIDSDGNYMQGTFEIE